MVVNSLAQLHNEVQGKPICTKLDDFIVDAYVDISHGQSSK